MTPDTDATQPEEASGGHNPSPRHVLASPALETKSAAQLDLGMERIKRLSTGYLVCSRLVFHMTLETLLVHILCERSEQRVSCSSRIGFYFVKCGWMDVVCV